MPVGLGQGSFPAACNHSKVPCAARAQTALGRSRQRIAAGQAAAAADSIRPTTPPAAGRGRSWPLPTVRRQPTAAGGCQPPPPPAAGLGLPPAACSRRGRWAMLELPRRPGLRRAGGGGGGELAASRWQATACQCRPPARGSSLHPA